MLEFDDIQFLLLANPALPVGRYSFLTIRQPDQGRSWLARVAELVTNAQATRTADATQPWRLSVAFTWNGLRALGVDEASLATFPEDFRQGMPARAEILGDTGANHPDAWVGGLSSADLHAMVVLYARDETERERWQQEHQALLTENPGVTVLSGLDVAALSLDAPREHFGYRDRISVPQIEGNGVEPTPGTDLLKPGEFILGYESELGLMEPIPQPEVLSRNGSYLAYRRNRQHVAAFRDFLREQGGPTPEEQELLAAKLLGRWRSGAPLVLAPEQDDPALAADPQRNNNFAYNEMDPYGYACPISAHIRRVNPRDTVVDPRRRRLRRVGFTYGPALPEGDPEDGVDRGIAGLFGCSSLSRQFEFVQHDWIQDPAFEGRENERDPIAGAHDGTYDFTIPQRPLKKTVQGLPAFTTMTGGAYLFLPGITGLRFLAGQARADAEGEST